MTKIHNATEFKVKELLDDSKQFESIRDDIRTAAVTKTATFLADADYQIKKSEHERLKKMQELEASLDKVQSGQILTFLGGIIIGGVSMFLFGK